MISPAQTQYSSEVGVTHGGTSKRQIRPVMYRHKRRFLRHMHLHVSDLDAVEHALLDDWARAMSQVTLLQDWLDWRGLVDEAGEPFPATKLYQGALVSARRCLAALQEHLARAHAAGTKDPLRDYLADSYAGNGDDGDAA